jgi:hypothetical protein
MEAEISAGKKSKEGKRKIAGVVTARDVKACLWVCEQGCMTVDQIWRAVWWSDASRGPRYAYERVLFLERAGFLTRVQTNFSLKSYFRATRAAQELAGTSGETHGMVPLASPAVNEIPHADQLTELRLAVLAAGRCASWKPDRVLAIDPTFPRERFYGLIPDAIWTTPSGKRIAVEYERTRKGVARVRTKVEALSREMARPDRAIDLVLWVAAPGAYQDLEGLLQSHPGQRLRQMEQFLAELKKPDTGQAGRGAG